MTSINLIYFPHLWFSVVDISHGSAFSEFEPMEWCEIDGLSNVESKVESSMIGIGERDHEFSFLLNRLTHLNAMFPQSIRRHHRRNVKQQIWLLSQLILQNRRSQESLKFLRLIRRNAVPLLSSSLVQVVNGIEQMVLHVPAEGSVLHAHVQPRHNDAWNVVVDETEKGVSSSGQSIEVHGVRGVGIIFALGKARSKAPSRNVSSIEHLHFLISILHNSPEFVLHFLVASSYRFTIGLEFFGIGREFFVSRIGASCKALPAEKGGAALRAIEIPIWDLVAGRGAAEGVIALSSVAGAVITENDAALELTAATVLAEQCL